jgi:hypothetical protein
MSSYINVIFKKDRKSVGSVLLDYVRQIKECEEKSWIFGSLTSRIRTAFWEYPNVASTYMPELLGRIAISLNNSSIFTCVDNTIIITRGKGLKKENGKYSEVDVADTMEIYYLHERSPQPPTSSHHTVIIDPKIGRPCFGAVLKSDPNAQIKDLYGGVYIPENLEDKSLYPDIRLYLHCFEASTSIPKGIYFFVFVSGERPGQTVIPYEGVIRILEIRVQPNYSAMELKAAEQWAANPGVEKYEFPKEPESNFPIEPFPHRD